METGVILSTSSAGFTMSGVGAGDSRSLVLSEDDSALEIRNDNLEESIVTPVDDFICLQIS